MGFDFQDDPQEDLILAIENGEQDEVQRLLDSGEVDIEGGDEDEPRSPLYVAAAAGSDDMISLLLKAGATIETERLFSEPSLLEGADDAPICLPLSGAASFGHTAICERLLELGASLEQRDSSGKTALIRAVDSGHLQTVELLLRYGADINQSSPDGTALAHACVQGNLRMVAYLLKKGADLAVPSLPAIDGARQAWTVVQVLNEQLEQLRERGRTPDPDTRILIDRFLSTLEFLYANEGVRGSIRDEVERGLQTHAQVVVDRSEELRALTEGELMSQSNWLKKVRHQLKLVAEDLSKSRDFCVHVLANPQVISHPQWSELIRSLIQLTPSYSELTQKAYGTSLSYAQDEDGPLQDLWNAGFDSTLDDLFELVLSTPKAIGNPDWSALMLAAIAHAKDCEARPIEALQIALQAGSEHPEIVVIQQAAQEIVN